MSRDYKKEYQKRIEKISSLTEDEKKILYEKSKLTWTKRNKKVREQRKLNDEEYQTHLNKLKTYRENNKEKLSNCKKEWYKENKNYVKDKEKKSYKNLRENAIQELGGKCVKCGTSDNLEFNHIDPLNKKMEASGKTNFRQGEYKKCELMCKSCHRKWSNIEASFARKYWLETLSVEERRRRIDESF
jgi:hypothetical protein